MAQTLRAKEIIEIAERERMVTVDGLAKRFGVTLQTIRRDLTDLANAGKLERVHGGAVLPSRTTNIGYADRQSLNFRAKNAIAAACAAHIPNDVSVFLNIGTTTEAVARALADHQNVLAVTNNMNVAQIFAGHPGCEVILTGGTLRRADRGLVGPLAVDTVRSFKFDIAIIGCSALDSGGDILDFDVQEVGVSKAIIEQSRRVYLVADHTKFERTAPARIGSLRDIDMMFTDRPLTHDLAEKCSAWQTTVVTSVG